MSADLALQQQALLNALWALDVQNATNYIAAHINSTRGSGQKHPQNTAYPAFPGRATRGLHAYRSHGRELAVRALSGAYPVVAQLLGEDNFAGLAKALWLSHPPSAGDVARWGQDLPAFLAAQPELMAEDPYVPDVARVEWALHAAASAADAQVEADTFPWLAQHDPAALTLALGPGWMCVPSAYPVVSIVNAHLLADPPLATAGQRLRDGVAETALVWRQGLKPCVRLALPDESAFLQALAAGHTLWSALEAAPRFDFGAWLAPAVQTGLLIAVRACATADAPISKETP